MARGHSTVKTTVQGRTVRRTVLKTYFLPQHPRSCFPPFSLFSLSLSLFGFLRLLLLHATQQSQMCSTCSCRAVLLFVSFTFFQTMSWWPNAPHLAQAKRPPQGGWCDRATWAQGGMRGSGWGGRDVSSEGLWGTFVEEPSPSAIMAVSAGAKAGVACSHLKSRCFSWSYDGIVLNEIYLV